MNGPAAATGTDSGGDSEGEGALQGIALLGEEMLTWSDLDGGAGGGPGATRGSLAVLLLEELRRAVGRPGRALVVGPHAAEVVLDVAGVAEHTDVLVRSYPDAETLRAALPASVGVHCGPLDRFASAAAASPYDVVVALDGLDRLHSAETERPGWEETAGRLAVLVAPGGDLLVAVPNAVGLDQLLALDPRSRRGDARWPEGQVPGPDASWPGPGVEARAEALAATLAVAPDGESLRVTARWACFGPRRHPRLAAPVELVEVHGADRRLVRLATQASALGDTNALGETSAPGEHGSPPISDPGEAVASVVAAGLGARLAPQWVVHLTRRSDDAATGSDADALLVAESPDDRPSVPHRVRVGGSGWIRDPATAVEVQWTADVRCDPGRLAGPLPSGTSLEDHLAVASAAHDLVAAGDLVRRYRDWLAVAVPTDEPASGPAVPGDVVPLTFADLVEPEDGTGPAIEVADGRLVADAAAPLEEVLVRTLLVAGHRLLAHGTRHPWSATASPATIARSLAAAAGIEVEPPLMDRAVALDRRLRPDPVDFVAVAPPAASYADLVDQVAEQRDRLTEAAAQLEWLVSNIHVRQRALRASRGRVADLETSAEFRIGKRVLPFRTLVKKGRDWARERKEGPMHEWRAKPRQRDPIPVDPDLLPKGYQPKGDEV